MTKLIVVLRSEGMTTKGGKPIDKGYVYRILNNRVYLGEAVHKGTAYPGEHQAIIDRTLWDRVHTILRESPRKRGAHTRAQTPALLSRAAPTSVRPMERAADNSQPAARIASSGINGNPRVATARMTNKSVRHPNVGAASPGPSLIKIEAVTRNPF